MGREPRFGFAGRYYRVEKAILEPKPLRRPRPVLYAGGESPAAKVLIARACDGYLMHGDPPERIAEKVADMRTRREGLRLPPLLFRVAPPGGSSATGAARPRDGAPVTSPT